jgi:hypothetical protein
LHDQLEGVAALAFENMAPLERISIGFTTHITLTRTRCACAALSLAGRGTG